MESAQGRRRSCGGFSLIELLLALALGLLLCGLVIQALAADGQGLQRLVRRQRQARGRSFLRGPAPGTRPQRRRTGTT